VPARPPSARKRRSRRGRVLRIKGLLFIVAALALGGYIWWNLWGTGFAASTAQEDLRPTFERNVPARPPSARKRRSRRGRVLRITGLLFIVAALALGGYIWWNLWGTGFAASAAQEDLRPAFERNVASLIPADAPERVANVPGKAVAIIKIPKIEVDLVVVEGTNTESLKKGPGHYTKTAYPWEDTGRVGIAGHRTTYGAPFWSLNELREGDRVVLATEYGIFNYQVTRTVITPPSGILPSGAYILGRTERPSLVLTTCNPRFSAAERLIVIADRVDGP
jgi:sortase A